MMRVRLLTVIVSVGLGAACSEGPRNPLSPAMSAASLAAASAHAGHASYDATGLWNVTVLLNGQQIGEGVHMFSQDAAGNLTGVGTEAPDDPDREHGTYTFTRTNAPGAPIGKYRLTYISPAQDEESCGRNLSGKATLNSRTNTIEAQATGVIDNCATVTVSFTWQKQ